MSMFSNLIGGAPAPVAPQPQQTQQTTPGNIPPNAAATGAANQNTAPNGVAPGNENSNPAPTATPFDQFADLWKTPESSGDAKPTGVFGDVDPKKFMEAAGKIDFAKVVTPDQLQQISAGGESAMAAFAQALNAVAQTTYASTKIVEQAMARAKDSFLAELPQHIKQQTVKENLRANNPVFSNPAVQPIISALEAQLTVKYPNATAGEITSMAQNYVEALGTSFAPKQTDPKSQGGKPGAREETDWSSFLQ
jgi:hypothetical protein